jgi:hypothetical protein
MLFRDVGLALSEWVGPKQRPSALPGSSPGGPMSAALEETMPFLTADELSR